MRDWIPTSIQIASDIQTAANSSQTRKERAEQVELHGMINDPKGKAITVALLDQVLRPDNNRRIASQIIYLLNKYGIPSYLPFYQKAAFTLLRLFGKTFTSLCVPLIKKLIRDKTEQFLIPGETASMDAYLEKKRKAGVRVNINHLGEAILGEEEAQHRLQEYLKDLENPLIDYISVKISTLYSQINLLAWDDTLNILAERYRKLLRAAKKQKFVNLDMEEYRDLHLTVALFKKVLAEDEFQDLAAGIVLQSYLPDAFPILQDLTEFAKTRKAPIKVRIVKGANLAMEKVEAALRGWPQAPYETKIEVDSNFKKMVDFAITQEHAKWVHIGIGSHNLFDIAYAMALAEHHQVKDAVTFEMLEGMSLPTARTIRDLTGAILLYSPTVKKEDMSNAIAYLVRRLDENTGPENFLRVSMNLVPGKASWQHQANLFAASFDKIDTISTDPRRTQNRFQPQKSYCKDWDFRNDPDTDFSLPKNREWVEQIVKKWKQKTYTPPVQTKPWEECLQKAIVGTVKTVPIFADIAQKLRETRDDLIGAMMLETHKTVPEADIEVSEAIDFAEYYRINIEHILSHRDIQFSPKGVIVVASPWNFPCSIPAGGILAALAGGNSVIFKPAPEAVLVGQKLVEIFWEAGVLQEQLQFLPCSDADAAKLVKDPRVASVILTGGTATAKEIFRIRPGLDLMAETGGKNSIIVTAMADRDLAVKDIVQSAFGYAGQKCSACSLAILEAEVYDDPKFAKQLKDATESLIVGSPWDLATKVNPLIRPPVDNLLKAISDLEKQETWLVKPKQDPKNPHILTPGIKWDVKPGSFTHMYELFGPVLAVIRANDLDHAIKIANTTPYGLTAGLQSLDEREHAIWLSKIEAGNCYINRGITGAIVERQPFGGTKASSFGPGAKAGGPNYVMQMMVKEQLSPPSERSSLPEWWHDFPLEEKRKHNIIPSIGSYSFYWIHYFSKDHDPLKIWGEDNIQRYLPFPLIELRVHPQDELEDIIKVIAAAKIVGAKLHISSDNYPFGKCKAFINNVLSIPIFNENERAFINRISKNRSQYRVRLLQQPTRFLTEELARLGRWITPTSVLDNGRVELLHYLREVSISYDYHRYGNPGLHTWQKPLKS